MSHNPPTEPGQPGIAKTACDQCHRCKLRCTRELPQCQRCRTIGSACTFSTGKPIGKPRGSKNKNSKRKAASSDGDEDKAGERPGTAKRKQSQSVSTLPTLTPKEAWQDPFPLFHQQHLSNGDGDPAAVLSPSVKAFPDEGSSLAHRNIDASSQHAKNNGSMVGISNGIGAERMERMNLGNIPRDGSMMLPWTNTAVCDSSEASTPTAKVNVLAKPPPATDIGTLHPPTDQGVAPTNGGGGGGGGSVDQTVRREPSLTINTALNDIFTSPASLPSVPSCLCNPTALRIMEAFQYAQLRPADALLDRSLLLLRKGVDMCERSLSCISCRQASSALASLMLMQGAMRCYSSILTARTSGGENVPKGISEVTIGGFEVDDSIQSQVVAAVVRAEMRRAVGVLVAFEKFVQDSGSSSRVSQAIYHLSRALREELNL